MSGVIRRLVANIVADDVECEICSGDVSNGDNFMALVQRVDVRGNNIDLHLVAKQAPFDNDFHRRLYITRQAYLREIYVYKTVLPCFEVLQKEHNVRTPFRSYAKYYASCDDDFDECILLENLKTLGYDNWNTRSGVDLEHALLIFKNLGRLHALSFALRHHKPDVFDKIRRNLRDNQYEDPRTFTSDYVLEMITKRAMQSLDPVEDRVALENIACLAKHVRKLVKTALGDTFHSNHAVVTHGDCWLPNLLFRSGEVCFLDWQFTRLGSPAFDVAQILFLCCDHELRNGHYEELLRTYHASLADFLQLLDADVHELLPYTVLLEHLKEYGVLALVTSFRAIYLTFLKPEDVHIASQVTSDDNIAMLFQQARLDDNLYDRTMRGIILDYIEFGYKL